MAPRRASTRESAGTKKKQGWETPSSSSTGSSFDQMVKDQEKKKRGGAKAKAKPKAKPKKRKKKNSPVAVEASPSMKSPPVRRARRSSPSPEPAGPNGDDAADAANAADAFSPLPQEPARAGPTLQATLAEGLGVGEDGLGRGGDAVRREDDRAAAVEQDAVLTVRADRVPERGGLERLGRRASAPADARSAAGAARCARTGPASTSGVA